MTARWISWKHLRPGDLFQSVDDFYPLRVIAVRRDGSVDIWQDGRYWTVFFRHGAKVLRFRQ